MRTIAIALQAGGVGKTTLTHNLGTLLADRGKRVLMIDADGQCNLTDVFAVQEGGTKTVYEVLVPEPPLPVGDAIVQARNPLEVATIEKGETNVRDGLFLLPGSREMAKFDVAVAAREMREYLLREALAPIQDAYDYVLIDCPPGLGMVLFNALLAADEVLIPVQTRQRRVNALPVFLRVLVRAQKYNPSLHLTGIVPNQYDRRNSHDRQAYAYIERFTAKHNFRLFPPIPTTTRIPEAESHRLALCDYDRDTPASDALEALADEIVNPVTQLNSAVSA